MFFCIFNFHQTLTAMTEEEQDKKYWELYSEFEEKHNAYRKLIKEVTDEDGALRIGSRLKELIDAGEEEKTARDAFDDLIMGCHKEVQKKEAAEKK